MVLMNVCRSRARWVGLVNTSGKKIDTNGDMMILDGHECNSHTTHRGTDLPPSGSPSVSGFPGFRVSVFPFFFFFFGISGLTCRKYTNY